MNNSSTILTIAVAFFVGGALKDFFMAISRDLIAPFAAAFMPGTQQSLEKITIQIGPVKLSIGDAIAATMTLMSALFVVSITLPYVREYSPLRGGK